VRVNRFPYSEPSCGSDSSSHVSHKLLIDFPIQNPVMAVIFLTTYLTDYPYISLYSTQLQQ